MRRNLLILLASSLLAACSTPSFMGDGIRSDAGFLGKQDSPPAAPLTLASAADYPTLESDINSILQDNRIPPPVTIGNPSAADIRIDIPAPDAYATPGIDLQSSAADIRIDIPAPDHHYNPPAPAAALQSDSGNADNSPAARAYAYLKALFRGDGEGAWRYATVPANPRESWWDSNTAKGALYMKAGSSEYFAREKQGVSRIDIAPHSVRQQDGDARLTAHITYGNGSRSNMNLHLVNQSGQWLVAEE